MRRSQKKWRQTQDSAERESGLLFFVPTKKMGDTRYLIDQRKVTGSVAIEQNGLTLYPYHLLLIKNDFAYAEKVKFSSSIFSDKIKISEKENNKRTNDIAPVEYMAELNNFPAVKFLIEKEGYEFGTFSNYEESVNALGWAKKNKNGEMEKYLDDKISGWTTAGIWTRNILLAPLMILVLLAAH